MNQQYILDRIEPDTVAGCWLWTGAISNRGYGMAGRGKPAHRYSYEAFNGPIPEGLQVCHKCDVRPCCNPDHLFVGTAQENIQDALIKKHKRLGLAPWIAPAMRPVVIREKSLKADRRIIAVRPIKGSALEKLMLEKREKKESLSPWLHAVAESKAKGDGK